jgi:FdhD protein
VAERTAVATASCGICGKASIDDVAQRCDALPAGPAIARSVLLSLPHAMRAAQAVFDRTGGLHATACSMRRARCSAVRGRGRHNALDKLIGGGAWPGVAVARVALVSGRVSFEVAQKAAIAGIAVLAAVSAPTDCGRHRATPGMTLVGFCAATA